MIDEDAHQLRRNSILQVKETFKGASRNIRLDLG
jgi:hypothetical protein